MHLSIKLILLLQFAFTLYASAQYYPIPDRKTLQSISKEMYEAGNEKYIVVDAIADTLIVPNRGYGFMYVGGDTLIVSTMDEYLSSLKADTTAGGILLPPALKQRYLNKLRVFLQRYSANGLVHISSMKGVLRPDMLDPLSSFRLVNLGDRYKAGIKSKGYKQMAEQLISDGLATQNAPFELSYIKGKITINGNKLKGDMHKKYAAHLNNYMGIDIKQSSGRWTSDKGLSIFLK